MQKVIERRAPGQPFTAPALSPLLNRLYAARGVRDQDELNYALAQLAKPDFKGLTQAVQLLADAIYGEARILVVGDFDADGATASALAVEALTAMGHRDVQYLVPNRFEYGYGLTPEIVAVAAARAPEVILTVDNGISSIEGVAAAQALGIAVVITDHHLPGEQLPAADAIVNPNQSGCPFPSKHLAGVGVIFYVMNALKRELDARGWFAETGRAAPNMANFLDLVAFGTVADVVPLDHNNRILVSQGLARMRAGNVRPGIAALAQIAKRELSTLSASDIGFALGPRLNAAGRLDDMSLGIQCLLAGSLPAALNIAQTLDDFNRERKAIEASMQVEALAMLAQFDAAAQPLPQGVCLFDASWHQGVIGILASRIKERVQRPTIVFADVGEGLIKGSARSVPDLHIRDALDAIAARYPHLLQKFGGHAMAAGMSLAREDFAEFARAFDEEVIRVLGADAKSATLITDGQLQPAEISLATAQLLRSAGPWGQQFAPPQFDGVFHVVQKRILAERHLKLTLALDAAQQQWVDAIAFNIDADYWRSVEPAQVRLVYKLEINEFRGNSSVQLLVDYVEAVDPPSGISKQLQ